MRHGIKGRKLSRTAAHRKVTMQSLAMALIREHRITTTLAKAKELRGFVEPLITRAKEDTHHNRRQVFSSLQNKEAVTQLFTEVGPKSKDRPGGYTRVIKAGYRKGDGAEIAIVELVDYNDIKPEGSSSASDGKKKTRRAGKSNTPTTSVDEKSTKEKKEEPAKAEDTEVVEDSANEADNVVADEEATEDSAEEKK
ncbi:MAG: 50S ribosomal protein L17 [Balneola sp.]|jgi:large subunit ribosomal protein L17|nr:50S ribosomal protein L17 [Balneola sp.]MBE80901.1 50S ribosomal protein L17 [Balneola sp.]HBX67163.1 50S ribosomal protein L17 [Balneolaceae bacterium]|tara:strand:+ start:643 stop:1230 length:588 start_codon:yes stop_codon:yes gene_type:complete